MDWLSACVSTHAWLTYCPLLTCCPVYCAFFASWLMMYFALTATSRASIAVGNHCGQQLWPTGSGLLPTCCPLYCPVPPHVACVALFCSDSQLLKRHQRNPLSPCQHQHQNQLFSTTTFLSVITDLQHRSRINLTRYNNHEWEIAVLIKFSNLQR